MEFKTNAYLIKGLKIERKLILINEDNHKIIQKALDYQRKKIVNVFKRLKKEGKINSIYRPANKKIKNELRELIKIKKEMLQTIEKIKLLYA